MALQRQTIISKKLIEILKETAKPVSIKQILKTLQEMDIEPNKSTLYRILAKLEESGEVIPIHLQNGSTYFEWQEKKHHHHFFCTRCEQVTCLHSCVLQQNNIDLQNFLPNANFKIQKHDFNLYGLCEKCSA